jgi:branched-chain amino acid transport system substrate-binding protein
MVNRNVNAERIGGIMAKFPSQNPMARIKEYDGITGKMTFTEDGDPIKCAVIVKISDKGEYEFYKSVCP